MQRVDDEAAVAQDLDPLAMAEVEAVKTADDPGLVIRLV
jgi:hypothetical protein